MTRSWMLPAIACAALVATPAAAGWIDEASLELRSDDNLSRAQLARDIKADTALVASATSDTAFDIGDSARLKLSVALAATVQARYEGLNNVAAGLAIRYRRKFGLGAYAPVLALAASATRLEFRDRARDGWQFEGEAEFEKRLSQRFDLHLAYGFTLHRPDVVAERLLPSISADVFDLSSQRLRLGADYLLAPQYLLSANWTLHKGDIVSTTLRNLPIFLAADAIAADHVFGPGRFAYRLTAMTRDVQIGISRLLGHDTSLTLAYQHLESDAEGGIDYRANRLRATFLRRF